MDEQPVRPGSRAPVASFTCTVKEYWPDAEAGPFSSPGPGVEGEAGRRLLQRVYSGGVPPCGEAHLIGRASVVSSSSRSGSWGRCPRRGLVAGTEDDEDGEHPSKAKSGIGRQAPDAGLLQAPRVLTLVGAPTAPPGCAESSSCRWRNRRTRTACSCSPCPAGAAQQAHGLQAIPGEAEEAEELLRLGHQEVLGGHRLLQHGELVIREGLVADGRHQRAQHGLGDGLHRRLRRRRGRRGRGVPPGTLVVDAAAEHLTYRVADERPWMALALLAACAVVVVVVRLVLRRNRRLQAAAVRRRCPASGARDRARAPRGLDAAAAAGAGDDVRREADGRGAARLPRGSLRLAAGTRTTKEIVGDLLGVVSAHLDVGLIEKSARTPTREISPAGHLAAPQQAPPRPWPAGRALIIATAEQPPERKPWRPPRRLGRPRQERVARHRARAPVVVAGVVAPAGAVVGALSSSIARAHLALRRATKPRALPRGAGALARVASMVPVVVAVVLVTLALGQPFVRGEPEAATSRA